MNSTVVADPEPALWSASIPACQWDACQRVAVHSLRRLARGRDGALPFSPGMARAAAAFRAFLDGADQAPGARAPVLGAPGSPAPSKDERRLLRALAAAQHGDYAVLDAYLCKFALDRRLRAGLADAVCALAAALAAGGVVLPARASPPIPAPALRVAIMRGQTPEELDVDWPSTPRG